MDLIEPSLYYLQKKGFHVTREKLQKIEGKLRELDFSQKQFIKKIIEIYWKYLINFDDKQIIFTSEMLWLYDLLLVKNINCKINKQNEIIIYMKKLRPIFPDEIINKYIYNFIINANT